MSNMHHTVNYPYVEHFYGDGIITFWFRLGTELAAQLPLIVRHKISKATEAKIETRRDGVFGVTGYVPEVYAAMEQVCAKLHLSMPPALVELKKEDDEEFACCTRHRCDGTSQYDGRSRHSCYNDGYTTYCAGIISNDKQCSSTEYHPAAYRYNGKPSLPRRNRQRHYIDDYNSASAGVHM
ncbi:hypothetical protein AAVH_24987 [Aphelenchoides avenae]|nr:hypothetical protein AAVH_24987 [Aphelenchus avenae]